MQRAKRFGVACAMGGVLAVALGACGASDADGGGGEEGAGDAGGAEGDGGGAAARDGGVGPSGPARDGGGSERADAGRGEPPAGAGPDGGDTPPREVPAGVPADGAINPGWIGGACAHDAECTYASAFCQMPEEGWPRGHCSAECERFCPDRAGDANSVTFCVDGTGVDAAGGQCVARCDFGLSRTGCRAAYDCVWRERHAEADVVRAVCLPAAGDGAIVLDSCARERLDAGVRFEPVWMDETHPDGAPSLVCRVDGAMNVAPRIGGVTYRYIASAEPAPMRVACALAAALERLSAIAREFHLREVLHIGTYNCRTIAGTNTLSMHGLGLAIDLGGFVGDDGREYIVEQHWEKDEPNPTTPEGQLLYEVAHRLHEERVFNVILTPDYNAAHYNHLHVDLTEGSDFFKRAREGGQARGYLGPNTGH